MLDKYKIEYPNIDSLEFKDDKYYFIDNKQIKEINKDIDVNDVVFLFKNYYVRTTSNKKIFDYLFINKEFPVKEKSFKFLVINGFGNIKDSNVLNNVIEVFSNIFIDCLFFEMKEDLIIIYFNNDIEVEELVMSITDDLGYTIKTFSSCKINVEKNNSLIILYEMYKKYFNNTNNTYVNTSDLLLEIVKKNILDLAIIKEIVLKKIAKDSQLQKLILAMFDNSLNVTQTAKDTYMHRNTINNKLEYIKEETDLNIQRFKDAVSMYYIIKS